MSCNQKQPQPYSFFVAGTSYGNPDLKNKNSGIYKPFKEKFNLLNQNESMKMGFFLGDVVWQPNKWEGALEDISKLNMEIHMARGNHDGKLIPFEKRFGKSYKSFFKKKDLFIVLDPNIDHWNISGNQLRFLRNVLRNDAPKARNIFIFSHQVIWWSQDKLSKPLPNSLHDRAKQTNYWNEIEPLLFNLNKPVYLFSGDTGAFSKERRKKEHIIEYSYFDYRGIKYISTGMGGGVRDNFVVVNVDKLGSVDLELIHLNFEGINSLGNIEDYIVK
ncbi:metallophosphoesterase [Flavobacteriaceae bacterium]|nr:metallophosphoesterase [Flavobacteriaceae bacterium]